MTWGSTTGCYLRCPVAVGVAPPMPRPVPGPTEPTAMTVPRQGLTERRSRPEPVTHAALPKGWPALPDAHYRIGPRTGKVYHYNREVCPCPKCGQRYAFKGFAGCQVCADADGTRVRAAAKRRGR